MKAKRETVGYFSSFLIHAALFLGFSAVMVRPARYGVRAGVANMEVDLVAPAKQEEPLLPDEILREPEAPAAEKMPEQVKPKAPEKQVPPKIAPPDSGAIRSTTISKSTVIANPNYLLNPAPPYPELARSMRQEGLVMLLVEVDRAGKPTKVDIEKSSGYVLLDQTALKAVSHWKFQPARIGGLAIESKVEVPIRFRLDQ